ncbi:IS110 family transposase [Hydrogenophaga pseudoflava]|uniref:Transposase IS116/IS110/IS902 family protein n=1 Tax=Hydrogenophaga pseudoflava TaxID=47421 RepID=A0A4P6X6I8_HYDPS|nr:IS110 family transposase [Hydrogenophaga pseudoflava]QBM29371.1 Transposase IS116/IS110/IS902 family protein [Hydrogenophaga pseudoflava]
MHATTVAVDLAKSVFQIAVADDQWRIVETQRLTRTQFERWFANRSVSLVIMEACGSAHHWARWLNGLGISVRLLPAQYVRAYVRRNKTDATDAAALLEAARAADIRPVRVKSVEQQALQGLHRIRSLWMGTRTSRINALRGFCREFGITIPQGARTGVETIGRVLADPRSAVPDLIRHTASMLLEEIRLLEARIAQVERELASVARQSPACTLLLSVPGIGLLTATALVAATSGDVTHFQDARHFSSWFGLTPREYSSGSSRYLGRISKRRATATCACCSPTARAACCERPRWPKARAKRSAASAAGRWRCRAALTTTKPPVPWPTSSRASATPRCATTPRLTKQPG